MLWLRADGGNVRPWFSHRILLQLFDTFSATYLFEQRIGNIFCNISDTSAVSSDNKIM